MRSNCWDTAEYEKGIKFDCTKCFFRTLGAKFCMNCSSPVQTAKEGTKHDEGKPAMALLPPNALEQVARVMGYGASKYSQFNYLGGLSYIRLLSAGFRHGFAFLRGEDIDPESGLPHWAHAAACFLLLGEMTVHRPEMDDRYKKEKK